MRLPVARDVIGSGTVGFLDLENRGVAAGISFLGLTELEICLGSVATPPSVLRVSEIGSGLRGLRGHFKVTKVKIERIVLTVAPRPKVPVDKNVHRCQALSKNVS